MADNFDNAPYSYDPHGFIVAATTPMQPRAGAVPAQNPLAMQRGRLANGPAYQALMQALSSSLGAGPQNNIAAMTQNPALARAVNGMPPLYTPQGIPRAKRIDWQAMAPMQPAAPAVAQPQDAATLLPMPGSSGFTE